MIDRSREIVGKGNRNRFQIDQGKVIDDVGVRIGREESNPHPGLDVPAKQILLGPGYVACQVRIVVPDRLSLQQSYDCAFANGKSRDKLIEFHDRLRMGLMTSSPTDQARS